MRGGSWPKEGIQSRLAFVERKMRKKTHFFRSHRLARLFFLIMMSSSCTFSILASVSLTGNDRSVRGALCSTGRFRLNAPVKKKPIILKRYQVQGRGITKHDVERGEN
eukprot:GEMP01091690.1.p1 GENE.GEMP01091690.1~~GEMP01091690.1.p1  ORF type:complete len:108 (-),score=12.90 GEMP01091690.1:392-715(-)